MRLATAADATFLIERAAYNGQAWSEAHAEQLCTLPEYITVIDEEGAFYLHCTDGLRVVCGLHFGFESGSMERYVTLWRYCFERVLERWPDCETFETRMSSLCFAPGVEDAAVGGAQLKKAQDGVHRITRRKLAKALGF